MTSTVAETPYGDNDGWDKTPAGLDAIAQFNASYDASQNDNTIDPQLTFSNPSTPTFAQSNAFLNPPTTAGLDQTFHPDPMTTYPDYPVDFNVPQLSPYFHQTIESHPPARQQNLPSNLRFMHRRSSTAPPGDLQPNEHGQQHQQQRRPQQYLQQHQPVAGGDGDNNVIFHRQNTHIGTPNPPTPSKTLKSQPRSTRQSRRHDPYARPQRPQHHRSNTSGGGPTSVPPQFQQQMFAPPQGMMSSPIPIPNMMASPAPMASPFPGSTMMGPPPRDASQYTASRLCTPAAESPSPSVKRSGRSVTTVLSGGRGGGLVGISVEELRELIFEGVKKALEESGQGKEGGQNGEKSVGEGGVDGDGMKEGAADV